jgi:hypothetical protein
MFILADLKRYWIDVHYRRTPTQGAQRQFRGGVDMPDVPIDKNTSQFSAAASPAFQAISGSISPNHTTPGRIRPLHAPHCGGSIRWPATLRQIEDRQWRLICNTTVDTSR